MDSPEIQPKQEVNTEEMSQAEIAARYGLAKWIFRRGLGLVKGKILEIGKGEGLVAKYCRREGLECKVLNVNLTCELFEKAYENLLGEFDLIYVLLNGQEMINSRLVVANCADLLKAKGCLIALIPCQTALYEGLAQGVKDWMSYNRRYIKASIGTHFSLEKARFFEVMKNLPPLLPAKNEYEENIRLFKKTSTNNFVPIGLFAVAIGRKL